jgi:hypothetical protein
VQALKTNLVLIAVLLVALAMAAFVGGFSEGGFAFH